MKQALDVKGSKDDMADENSDQDELTREQRVEYFESMRLRSVLKTNQPFLTYINQELDAAESQVAEEVHLRIS